MTQAFMGLWGQVVGSGLASPHHPHSGLHQPPPPPPPRRRIRLWVQVLHRHINRPLRPLHDGEEIPPVSSSKKVPARRFLPAVRQYGATRNSIRKRRYVAMQDLTPCRPHARGLCCALRRRVFEDISAMPGLLPRLQWRMITD